jgi:hypothetical protein
MPLDPTPGDPWHDLVSDWLPGDDLEKRESRNVFWLVIGIVVVVIGVLVVL